MPLLKKVEQEIKKTGKVKLSVLLHIGKSVAAINIASIIKVHIVKKGNCNGNFFHR